MSTNLTRRQQEIYEFLRDNENTFKHPPTLAELCSAMNLHSRGSMHKQIRALIDAGLVEPMQQKKRGIRLIHSAPPFPDASLEQLPMLGYIAAGQPIEAISNPESIGIPSWLHCPGNCYVLGIKGDSMIDAGIFDGDRVIIEQRDHADDGEIVVALIDGCEATLKRLQQTPQEVILHPANPAMEARHYAHDRVQIQGVLRGQMRKYH
ncbi:MAG: transcriptional repressor LexA [Pseudomonadota bacterium]